MRPVDTGAGPRRQPSPDTAPAAAGAPGTRATRAELGIDEIAAIVADLYGHRGTLRPLANERDLVYHLVTPGGEGFVLRVSGPHEPLASLELQNDALQKVATDDPALPVPRLCASRHGNRMEDVTDRRGTHRFRLMTFLPGIPAVASPRSNALLRNVGANLARIDKALAGLPTSGPEFPLLWDIRRAPQLRKLVGCVANAAQRKLADVVFDELEHGALARIARLPCQVIHNDFNPKNVLVSTHDPVQIVGIIDFGDVVRSCRAVDLGVTVARHMRPADALPAAGCVIGGYASVLSLRADEVAVLYSVARARLAMRAVIGCWRLTQGNAQSDPAQIEDAFTLLALLTRWGEDDVTRAFEKHVRG